MERESESREELEWRGRARGARASGERVIGERRASVEGEREARGRRVERESERREEGD